MNKIDIHGSSPLVLSNLELIEVRRVLSNFYNEDISTMTPFDKGYSGAAVYLFEIFETKKIIKLLSENRANREFQGAKIFLDRRNSLTKISFSNILREYGVVGIIMDFVDGIDCKSVFSLEIHKQLCQNFDKLFISDRVKALNPSVNISRYYYFATKGFENLQFTAIEQNKIKNLLKSMISGDIKIHRVHGDPSLGNIIYNHESKSINVVDFGSYSILPSITQRARFLNSIILSENMTFSSYCNRCTFEMEQSCMSAYRICDLIRRMRSDFPNIEKYNKEKKLCQKILGTIL